MTQQEKGSYQGNATPPFYRIFSLSSGQIDFSCKSCDCFVQGGLAEDSVQFGGLSNAGPVQQIPQRVGKSVNTPHTGLVQQNLQKEVTLVSVNKLYVETVQEIQ